MLRFAAVISLFIYISLSIGVHVDVDTCCKSIAGLSLFSESGDHTQALEEDCCAQSGIPSCHPITENTPEGCPSDCVYIQVLLDTPPPAISGLELVPTPVDVELIQFTIERSIEMDPMEFCIDFTSPPLIAIDEDLFLTQGSYITYG